MCARSSPRGLSAHGGGSQTFLVIDKDWNPLPEAFGPRRYSLPAVSNIPPMFPQTASDVSGQAEVTHTIETPPSLLEAQSPSWFQRPSTREWSLLT